MEFHFNADKEAASSVMTAWNMVVIQSVANDPDKLNSISSFLHSQGQGGERSSSRGSTRGLFRPAKPKNKSLTDSRGTIVMSHIYSHHLFLHSKTIKLSNGEISQFYLSKKRLTRCVGT